MEGLTTRAVVFLSSELYGLLGVSAVLLVWLYVIARLATGAAFLNATLWDRRYASSE